jgi:hypothetical protein
MMTEVWFRNPEFYVKELVEVGVANIVWDRGYVHKKRIDPDKHAQLYFGFAIPYRVLMVGEQGTAELRQDHGMDNPFAVYPTWVYGDDLTILEDMLENPAGQNMVACNDKKTPVDERPVWGQEHRVVVTDLPNINTGPGRKMMRILKELQEDYPDAILHVHGLYSYRTCFGLGFRSADVEPRSTAAKGKVILTSGKEVRYEQVVKSADAATVLGFKPVDLNVPRNRCMFNIKSAMWAGQYYNDIFNYKSQRSQSKSVDTTSPDAEFKPDTNNRTFTKNLLAPQEGDKFHCTTCSLQNECKYFRDGAVCTLPDAEPKELATFFRTRDSSMIIDGLGILMQANSRRLERSIKEEELFNEVNPEVTKMINQVFDQGIKLAKLVDPSLRGGAKVQVSVGPGGSAQINGGTPRDMVATVIRQLESQGIAREDITPDMVKGLLEGMANPDKTSRAVEGTVIAHNDEKSA